MKINGHFVDTSDYVRTHGKAPKGQGNWWFKVHGIYSQPVEVNVSFVTMRQAVPLAVAQSGIDSPYVSKIEVMP